MQIYDGRTETRFGPEEEKVWNPMQARCGYISDSDADSRNATVNCFEEDRHLDDHDLERDVLMAQRPADDEHHFTDSDHD